MKTALMLRAAGIGVGDEVVVPAFGNVEVAQAVAELGARPVFADIDPATYCLDPASVESVLTPDSAAVVVVHRFGRTPQLAPLTELGARRGLLVLQHQESEAPSEAERQRLQCAKYLDSRLKGVGTPDAGARHTYQQYVVRVRGNGRPDRDAFARAARSKGIDCRVPVPTPVHRLPRFRRDVHLPATEQAAEETLSLPIGERLTKRELQRTVAACNALGGILHAAVL
ncbi:DegT/DnrJ/EryC1/StrS family aminotransferase [Streptomyces sp. NPDC049954]|uniref:DegT/DnrJ/EryC1/StrS family aminotransferase n=1 Tax=Streptomyces sp. NPDC049954 TaxID=3155779 RepID=UPI0034365827